MVDFHRHINLPFPTNPANTYWYATSRVDEYPLYEGEKSHMHGYGHLYEQEMPTIESIIETHLKEDPLGYIGEIGIDTRLYHIISLEEQLEIVHSLTNIAISYSRPIVFHINAPLALMNNIFSLGKDRVIMIIHHFTGSVETAHELYKKGVHVSLHPKVWQKEMKLSKRIDELHIPILLETDYTGNDENQYETLLKNHYKWYEGEKYITHNNLVEQMHELSSVFQSYPITR